MPDALRSPDSDTFEAMPVRSVVTSLLVAGLTAAGCGGSEASTDPAPTDPVEEVAPVGSEAASASSSDSGAVPDDLQKYPDVIDASAVREGPTWTVSATLSSPYDTPERYADAWRVVGPDGTVYGERILTHDHAAEQPFTRSESGIEIPEDVDTVTIEGRDQQFGYGGDTFELSLPR